MSSLYHTNVTKSTNWLDEIGVAKNNSYYFELVRETPKGGVFRCISNPELTAFAYTSLNKGDIVLASITYANINTDGNLFVKLQIESVVEYASDTDTFDLSLNNTAA